MSTHMERDLRLALAARAAELPSDASARLLSFDYRPHTPRARPAIALAATTVTAGAALAFSLVGLGTDAPRAFAGWSAAPTGVTRRQLQRAITVCSSQLANTASRERERQAGSGTRGWLPAPFPTAGWHIVLLDTRGPYTTVVSEVDRGRAASTCFVDRRGQASAGTAVGVRPPPPVPAGEVSYRSSGSTTTPPDEGSRQFSMIVGRTGAGVTGVTLRLNDGTRVTASRAHGWFLAWWPGSHGLSATEVTTATGTTVRRSVVR
ncbi:MAG TPA: hypothetical protein VIJ66_08925 [Solirubrobacteraceae bacterium]